MPGRNKNGNGNKDSVEGLLPIVQDRLENDVFKKTSQQWNKIISQSPNRQNLSEKLVLIVDEPSLHVVSSALGMYKLTESNVYLVEHIVKKRAPYPKSAPIYFLSPTEDSIKRLIQDWTPSSAKPQAPYADYVFLYFTNALPDTLLNAIKNCKPLVRRIKALGEVNIDFIPHQTRTFHLDIKSSECFAQLFRTTVANDANAPLYHAISDKLVTLCASLNEFPHIRYKASSRVSSTLARLFSQKFNAFIGKNGTWWYHGDTAHTDKGRSTLLILSRADDCLSPLIHEFTYQAMVYDLLQLQGDLITFQLPNPQAGQDDGTGNPQPPAITKDALLNENDKIWVELRGKHIADVIQILSTRIREIVNSSTGVALNKRGNEAKALSLGQMANALKALPDYQEIMSKLSQHMHIAHQCMDIFKRQHLIELSDVEQTLATGKNEDDKIPRVSDMVDLVEQQLASMADVTARFRLLAIFIVSQRGLKSSDQGRLFTAANLGPEETRALGNLEVLGCPLVQPMVSNRLGSKFKGDKLVTRDCAADSGSEYSSSRFVCNMKDILAKMHANTLSFQEYPSIYPMPEENEIDTPSVSTAGIGSVRNTSSKFSARVGGNATKKIGGSRQLVFMAGGACHSELRAAQELMDNGGPEIIMGSTHFCDPTSFVKDIASL